MTKTIDDLIFLCKHMFGKFKDDTDTIREPFNEEIFNSKERLKIAYIDPEEILEIATCNIEALNDCKKRLIENGYSLVKFPSEPLNNIIYTYYDLVYSGQVLQNCLKALGDEEPLPI